MKPFLFLLFTAIGMAAAVLAYSGGGFALLTFGLAFLVTAIGALVAICLKSERVDKAPAFAA